MKTDLFQSCGHCWVFQICWHIECSTFTVSSFWIWNSSTGIPSPPLALFVVMLPKVHLTSHSRMSGYRWVIIPSWLSWSWRPFLYSSSVYSCHLFLYDPAISLLGIHNEETRIERDTCTPMFIAALFIIARTWKQPRCPSADIRIRKLWYIYTMEYYSALKRMHLNQF